MYLLILFFPHFCNGSDVVLKARGCQHKILPTIKTDCLEALGAGRTVVPGHVGEPPLPALSIWGLAGDWLAVHGSVALRPQGAVLEFLLFPLPLLKDNSHAGLAVWFQLSAWSMTRCVTHVLVPQLCSYIRPRVENSHIASDWGHILTQ